MFGFLGARLEIGEGENEFYYLHIIKPGRGWWSTKRELWCVLTEGGEKKGRTTDHLAPPATEAPLKAPAAHPSIHPFFIMYDF